MVDKKYKVVDAKDITSEEFLFEWFKAVRRELLEVSDRGLTPEEWENKFVPHEIMSLYSRFKGVIKSGNVGIKYTNPVKVRYETHEELDTSKATGVTINLVFEFEKPIDVPTD